MVRIPRLSYMVVRDSAGRDTIWMTEEPVMRNVIEEQWVGAYLASYYDNKLRSMKGETVAASRTINTFWDQAQANGKAFGLTNYTQRILMVLLYLSNYRSLNSQATLGYGMNGNAYNFDATQNKPTGETSSIGDACGSVDGGTDNANAKHISLFGLEDIYGWYWEMIQGVFIINNKVYVYDGNRMPDYEELAYGAKGLTIPVDGATDYTLVGNVAAWNNYKAKIGRYLLKSNGDAYKLNVYDSTILDYNDATFDRFNKLINS